MKTTAIQVIPIFDDYGEVDPQSQGPTHETTGWAVYLRKEDGTAVWFADTGSETDAMIIGQHLALHHGIGIEHQPWRTRRRVLTIELQYAWRGQADRAHRAPFLDWLRDMANDPNGTLQLASKELLILKGLK